MNNSIKPYSYIIIKLLQGPVYNDNRDLWNDLIDYQKPIRDYFNIIGVKLIISDSDGYAFLDNLNDKEEGESEKEIPDLLSKRQLSYPVTILSVLLVERLIDFDRTGGDAPFLIVSREEIIQMLKIFLSEKNNEARLIDSIDTNINKLVDYGFLRKMKNDKNEYEVRRILKAKVNADFLSELKERLTDYESRTV